MEEKEIYTLEELKSFLTKYEDGYLFRGQTQHYLTSEDEISLSTSFSRQKCVTHLMAKWTHYSKAILRTLSPVENSEISLELASAVLQHYGWRSFFIDVTKTPHIACWFAANKYEEKITPYFFEDTFQNQFALVHKIATYTNHDQDGHVYIINPTIIESLDIEIIDLTEIDAEDCRLRFHAQDGCLIGFLKGKLPTNSLTAHLIVKNHVLQNYYRENGINDTEDLFPDRQEDIILNLLLQLPWNKIQKDLPIPIPTYTRSLILPEYDTQHAEHFNPDTVLYDEFWIADDRGHDPNSPIINTPFFKVPEEIYFTMTQYDFTVEEINNLLSKHDSFVIELSGIVKSPELTGYNFFEKGVYVEKLSSDTVGVYGLTLEIIDNVIAGYGIEHGWIYEINGEKWERIITHSDQCPCNNNLRHEMHYSVLRIFNDFLEEKQFTQENNITYIHQDILEYRKRISST